MKNKSYVLIIFSLTLIFTSGCGVPECSFIIFDSTRDELLKDLAEYSLSEDIVQV